jgi:hypothetical protein
MYQIALSKIFLKTVWYPNSFKKRLFILLLLYFYLFICGILILLCMYFHMSNIWFFCPAHRPSKTFFEIVVAILVLLLLLWLRKTINVLMFTFRRMPGKMFFSFFCQTIKDWNKLPPDITKNTTTESFQGALTHNVLLDTYPHRIK